MEIRDTLLPGFGLRISVSGRKSWFVVKRLGDRQVRHTIGTYPVITLAEARDAGRDILRQMQTGLYQRERTEPAPVKTFEAVVRQFIERYAKPKNRDWRRTASVLQKFESLYERPFAEIRRADVICVLYWMMEEGIPIRANRALAAIKKLFAWALDRGLIEVHPIVGLKPPAKEIKRDRILTDSEVRAFWAAAEALGYPFGPAYSAQIALRLTIAGLAGRSIHHSRARSCASRCARRRNFPSYRRRTSRVPRGNGRKDRRPRKKRVRPSVLND